MLPSVLPGLWCRWEEVYLVVFCFRLSASGSDGACTFSIFRADDSDFADGGTIGSGAVC